MRKTRAPKGSRFQNNTAGKPVGASVAQKAAKSTQKLATRPQRGLPDRETLINYIRDGGETDKATLAKVFGLRGEERGALLHSLQSLQEDGALPKPGRRGFAEVGVLPEVGVVDVVERDT